MSQTIYEMITTRVTDLLQQGTVPWKKTWNATTNMPKNMISKKEYRGVNVFLLACMPYSSPYWMTYKQATDLKGHIRKGEKSTPVIFWKLFDITDTNGTSDTNITSKIPMLRYYNVFNLDQTEGIAPPLEPEETNNQFDPIAKAEDIVANMPQLPDIKYGGNRAYYSPTLDYIQLPHLHSFDSPEEFACCKFHEAIHSTGHINRIGRKSILEPSYFGSHEYSKEELVAEMGAAFLCGHSGIHQKTIDNSAAYIQGWLKALKNDKTLLVQAAAQAQKASDFILNHKSTGEESE